MSIEVACEICDTVLVETGGLIFTPPFRKTVDKWHICRSCFQDVINALVDLRNRKFGGK